MSRGFEICKGYENKNINLPKRQTKCAVGYDIEAAEDTLVPSLFKQVEKNETTLNKPTLIKTGIKAYFEEDEVMYLFNRSSGPSKRGLVLANSVGVFECDYYSNPTNDGEILVSMYNFSNEDIIIKKGERIAQAVFQKFLTIDGDNATGERLGGFGSTEK